MPAFALSSNVEFAWMWFFATGENGLTCIDTLLRDILERGDRARLCMPLGLRV
jgi:hypothetical protein